MRLIHDGFRFSLIRGEQKVQTSADGLNFTDEEQPVVKGWTFVYLTDLNRSHVSVFCCE